MNYKAVIQYKGTKYCGFAKQKSKPTVEAELEKALAILTKEAARVSVAGRTDAGVHALGQVISFKSDKELSLFEARYNLNALLPADIKVSSIEQAEDIFDARYSATARRYVYYLLNRRYPSLFNDDFCYLFATELDLQGMQKAASYLVGKHDFRAFSATGAKVKSFVREVYGLKIENKGDFFDIKDKDMIKIIIKANSFLHHMVRNIVGTLIEVGRGKVEPEKVEYILESRDRRKAARTAPAKGLFLEKVYY